MLEKTLRFFEKYIIPKFLYKMGQPIYHWLLAWTGSIFYGKPSREMFVIGITGTKGKSTTLEMIDSILKENGLSTAVLSSVKHEIDGQIKNKAGTTTMPGRWKIQRFLWKSFKTGCQYALIEVTSQGVEKHRHRFIDWNCGVFLNIHPEHIESHGSFEKYRDAKADFFRYLNKSSKSKRQIFINSEDPESDYFTKVADKVKNGEVIHFSSDDVYKLAEEIKEKYNPDWLKADFNMENMAAAKAVAKNLSIDEVVVKRAFENFDGVKGRLDFIQKKPFRVLIDYAHTPDSLRALYKNLRENDEFPDDGKLIAVFGSAGGGRDKWKRPQLGKAAGNYCDRIILTSEDPYSEDPRQIASHIKKGILKTNFDESNVDVIIDRREAIEKAVKFAQPGDTVAITGIGSQDYFYGPDGKVDWDEKEIARQALNNLNKNNEV